MENQVIPTKAGQVCTKENEHSGVVYFVTEDPVWINDRNEITVVRRGDLQRNMNDPSKENGERKKRTHLGVVGEDREDDIGWVNRQ